MSSSDTNIMMHHPVLIAITGGIGSGKSVVSTILKVAGYGVYDCDQRAKMLMNSDPHIKEALTGSFSSEIYRNGTLNRPMLSDIIFNDKESLHLVNSIVHPVVRDDILKWASQQSIVPAFIETAILKEGGLDTMVHEVWNVTAPIETRIERVIKRNNISRDKVIERINNQRELGDCNGKRVVSIVNDNTTPLLPQVVEAISKFL